jgi:hypothetical protein
MLRRAEGINTKLTERMFEDFMSTMSLFFLSRKTTSEYASFARLNKTFDSDLEIVLFPCGQFGGQEHPDGKKVNATLTLEISKSSNF